MGAQKWVRSRLRQLSRRLTAAGHPVSHQTVGRLLKDLDYALHVNVKKREASAAHPARDDQFAAIASQRQGFTAANLPIISVDTKKKELIGNFKNAGQVWSREAEAVNIHDCLGEGLGRAVPYGIYDVTANRGSVSVGGRAIPPGSRSRPSRGGGREPAARAIRTPTGCCSWPMPGGATAADRVCGSSNCRSGSAIAWG
jgi:DDE family transposase